jgi:hypothetical protein
VKPEQKVVAAKLSQEAEAIQNADPLYRADLETWTTTDLHRTDGVPVYAIPHTDERSEPKALVRNFDVSSTSPDADRPSRSNADLEATRSQHDHFGDWRLTWPPRSHPEPSAR